MPASMYDKPDLQALSHERLVELVLELQARIAELDASASCPKPPTPTPPTEQDSIASTQEMLDDGDEAPLQLSKFARSVSRLPANLEAAQKLRSELAEMVEPILLGRQSSCPDSGEASQRLTMLIHANYTLPGLRDKEPEFVKFIHSRLVASEYQEGLESELVLNWAVGQDLSEEHRLHVLRTAADGNCLLHSALLAMLGIHDTHEMGTSGLCSLRAVMSRLFREPRHSEPLRKRWKMQVEIDDAWAPERSLQIATEVGGGESCPGHIEVSDEQRERDWVRMVDIAGRPNEFLDTADRKSVV